MKRYVFLLAVMLLISRPPSHALEGVDSLLTLDFSYAFTGLFHQGWGLGLNYEKKVIDCFSVKGNLGHMTFLTGIADVYNTSVSISLFINFYPFSSGLDKLYISAGNGCDFMNYFGSGVLPNTSEDTLIHITPQIGWKFHIVSFLMIDVSTGYKFIISDTENYREIRNYVNPGFRFGVSFSIFLFNKNKDENDEQAD